MRNLEKCPECLQRFLQIQNNFQDVLWFHISQTTFFTTLSQELFEICQHMELKRTQIR
jgi:hypothetical protein